MKEIIFIAISFTLGLLCIKYIRSYDKHEKEPFLTMLAVTVWGGVWSVVIASLLYMAVAKFGVGDLKDSFGALFVIGPVEEFAKLIALISGFFIFRKEMNEPIDGMIYMSCVALGFSLIENYFYALRPDSGHLLFLRLFICTPMHICFSAFMGLSLYIFFKNKRAIGLLFLSFAIACVSHGIYDLVIFNGLALIVLYLVVRVIFSWTMDLLSYAVAQSPYRISLKDFIEQYPNPIEQEGIECLNCGSRKPKLTFSTDKLSIQKCDRCENYIVTKEGLIQIFHHFASTFKKLSNLYISGNEKIKKYSTLYKNNYISDSKKIAFFNLEKLDGTLEKMNKSIVDQMESKWWFPNNILELEKKGQSLDYKQIAIDGGGFFWRWLIYPFSSDKSKKLYPLPRKKPSWNWGAFIIPEMWFLYHEIWGVFFFITGCYMALIITNIYGSFNVFSKNMLYILILFRLVSGYFGNDVFYVMHGKWPIASWNKGASEGPTNKDRS